MPQMPQRRSRVPSPDLDLLMARGFADLCNGVNAERPDLSSIAPNALSGQEKGYDSASRSGSIGLRRERPSQ